MMNTAHRKRLQSESVALRRILPELAELVTLHATAGDPPTSYRLELESFGFVVLCDGCTEPERYDPIHHGPIELALAIDPDRYPYEPWHASLCTRKDVLVFNPHVGAAAGVRGGVCWHDQAPAFRPAEWPLHVTVPHVLRILAGETFVLEGYALHEAAKVWFATHLDALPFARVPETSGAAAPATRRVAPQGSDLGIEIELGRQP